MPCATHASRPFLRHGGPLLRHSSCTDGRARSLYGGRGDPACSSHHAPPGAPIRQIPRHIRRVPSAACEGGDTSLTALDRSPTVASTCSSPPPRRRPYDFSPLYLPHRLEETDLPQRAARRQLERLGRAADERDRRRGRLPCVHGRVDLDDARAGETHRWGVRLDAPGVANAWAINLEVPDAESQDRYRGVTAARRRWLG